MNLKKFIFTFMTLIVFLGLSFIIIFIIVNNDREFESKEIDKVQGTWELYSCDKNPLTWPKELPYVENQYVDFREDVFTYYVNGEITYMAKAQLDALFLRLTPFDNYEGSSIFPEKLRYHHFSDNNFNLIDESRGIQYDFIKHSGTYNELTEYSNEDINGEWYVKLHSHTEDGRKLTFDTINNVIKIYDKASNQEIQISFIWAEDTRNKLSTTTLGDVFLYMPNKTTLFLVQQNNSTIYELSKL